MGQIISLWAFSCNLYQRPGIQAHCLWLQDNHGVDVPVLLFCCWAARFQGVLNSGQIQLAKQQAELWRSQCIAPLRVTRREMKAYLVSNEPVDAKTSLDKPSLLSPDLWAQVREQIKAAELAGEKALLSTLESTVISSMRVTNDPPPTSALVGEAYILGAVRNIEACLQTDCQSLWQDSLSASVMTDILHSVDTQLAYDDMFTLVTRLLSSR